MSNEARLTEIQALVVALIHRLLSAKLSDVDAAIDDCLGRLGAYCSRDRAYVFVCDGAHADNTHEWCAAGIPTMIDQLQGLPLAEYDALFGPLSRNQVMLIPDIRDFAPGTAEHEILAAQDIRSLLLVPMLEGTDFYGLVGFDSVSERGDFLPGEVYLLRAFADVVRAVLMRRTAMQGMTEAQEELAQERAFMQGIVSTRASGFLVFDATGVVIYANDACADMLGIAVDQLVGQPFDSPDWALTGLDGRPFPKAQHPFSQVRASGRNLQNHRVALHGPDGPRYASINAAPIRGATSDQMQVVYAVTDVTALVEAEKTREAALAAAHRANEAKSHFLANMSHEIRTPLNGILGISGLLSDSITDPEQRRMLAILQESGNLLMSIINDLLDMTKIEADALQLEVIPFCPATLARRIEDVHTLRASDKRLSFCVRLLDPFRAPRLGDPHRIMQIVHNLVSNSIKFTPAGFVHVTLSAEGDQQIVLTVEDSGVGMTPEQQARIFEPFTQADTSISRRFVGTGLGMSIVRRLVEMMEGRLDIDSVPDQGTRITVSLPLPVAGPDVASQMITEPAPVAGDLPPMRILAADDNQTNQMILRLMLGQLGAQVTLVDDGLAALDHFRQDNFDLMLLDISMPRLDGVTLLKTLREIERSEGRARMPALAFTANAMTHQVESYLAAGFDGCLTKPLRLEKLREALLTFAPTATASG